MSERKCNKKEDFNLSYVGLRDDVFNLVPDNINKVLDMGCSIGALGKQIKRKNNNVEVVGVEIDKQMAKVA
jgi:16S rRNA A1518/A1519 N6-dimethyltransferase RsmA/KsgA/DIM1 with predicted DNA glycosylase/AP lyase activity